MRVFTAYLYVTLRCNARCEFCDIWRRREDASSDLPLELGAKLLEDLLRLGVRHVDFTGGEPMLYAELPELLGYARRLGLFTSVTSNGTLYPDRALELMGLPDSLGFSLNGSRAETHDASQGIPSFHKALSAIRLAVTLGEPVHAHFTADNKRMEDIQETVELAASLGVPLIIYPEFSYFGNDQLSDDNLLSLQRLCGARGAHVNAASLAFARGGGNEPRRPLCKAGRSALAILPDGSMALPCFHMRRYIVPTDGDLYNVYRHEDTQRLLDGSGRYGFCDGCTNWCYINPSFLHSMNRLKMPYIASSFRSFRLIYPRNWRRKAVEILVEKPLAQAAARTGGGPPRPVARQSVNRP